MQHPPLLKCIKEWEADSNKLIWEVVGEKSLVKSATAASPPVPSLLHAAEPNNISI